MSTTNLLDLQEAGLKTDLNTVRHRTERGRETIKKSVDETGYLRSGVCDEENNVLAGKGTLEDAQKREGVKIQFVDVYDNNTLVMVRKHGLTEQQKRRAMLWDNRASDLAKTDAAAVRRLVQENPQMRLLDGMYNDKEKAALLKAQADAQPLADGGTDEEVPELGAAKPVRQESTVSTISAFTTKQEMPAWLSKIRALGKVLEKSSVSDTVLALLQKAYDEWVVAPKEAAAAAAPLPAEEETEVMAEEALSGNNTVDNGAV